MQAAGPVRDTVRALLRDNGYAQRAHRTLCRATIGTGITGSPMGAGDKPASQRVRDAWDAWVDQCDFTGHHDLYGLQLLVARTMFESGEALIRFRRAPFSANERVAPVRLEVLEPDWVDVDRTDWRNNGGGWVDRGIEYDADGRKVALWLHQVHPGDHSRYLRARFQSVRVPVGEVEQVYDMLRPGQDRGISIFAGAVMPLKDLADYFDAEAMRKRVEACLSVFVTRSDPSDMPMLGVDAGRDAETGARSTRLVPGLVHEMSAGTSVTTLEPKGSPDITPFSDQLLFLAAAATGVMFEHMSGNMKYVNYSSYRVGSFDFAGAIEQLQWLTLRPRMCVPIAARFEEAAMAAGIFRHPARIRWTPPAAVTSPDPLKDAKANELNLRLGAVAPSELSERDGWTHAERLERIKADLDASDAIGVMFDGDPRKVRGARVARQQAGDEADGPLNQE